MMGKQLYILLGVLTVMVFLVLRVAEVVNGGRTLGSIASEFAVLVAVIGCAVAIARSVGRRRLGEAAGIGAFMLCIDIGASLLLGVRERPFLFPSTSFVATTAVVIVSAFALAPTLRKLEL
jgi:hypothetical protein